MEDGFRLPPPRNCPSPLHRLMLDCWQKDPGERPRFSQIHGLLSKMMQDPEPPRCADTPCARYGATSPVPGAFPTVPIQPNPQLSMRALPPMYHTHLSYPTRADMTARSGAPGRSNTPTRLRHIQLFISVISACPGFCPTYPGSSDHVSKCGDSPNKSAVRIIQVTSPAHLRISYPRPFQTLPAPLAGSCTASPPALVS